MNKQQILEAFDEKFVKEQNITYITTKNNLITGVEPPINDIKQFITETVIPEVIKSVLPEDDIYARCEIKQKARELYDITI